MRRERGRGFSGVEVERRPSRSGPNLIGFVSTGSLSHASAFRSCSFPIPWPVRTEWPLLDLERALGRILKVWLSSWPVSGPNSPEFQNAH